MAPPYPLVMSALPPKSGHVQRKTSCPLSANSGHQLHISSNENRRPASQRPLRKFLLMLHQDLGAERHARVKIGDIVVDQPEAT